MVTRARMFQYKPDGEVTFRMAQDAVGLPAPLMQDPIHYPHGTKFMAPGVSSFVDSRRAATLQASSLKHLTHHWFHTQPKLWLDHHFRLCTLNGHTIGSACSRRV